MNPSRAVVIAVFGCVLASETAHAVNITATIRDFRIDHPDFEDENGAEQGIVRDELGPDAKPVYAGDPDTDTTSGREAFDQWYRDVPGTNQSITILLPLTDVGGGLLEFESDSFFPVDDQLFGNEGNDHNFHFTTEIHARFTYAGGETFDFTGDDDVFVFINHRLALDLGGVHGAESASIDLDESAAELGIVAGEVYDLDMFHAERHTTQSNFRLTTTLALVDPDDVGVGDGEEPDPDDVGDGFIDFPDVDGDGLPDGCEILIEGGLSCPDGAAPDLDGDGVPDDFDPDRDGDGVDDDDDDDRDGDGVADADDDDLDGDGVLDADDLDVDGDRVPNVRDDDVDGDGVLDTEDDDVDGDGVPNAEDDDDDGDGAADENDVDDDGDGVPDAEDVPPPVTVAPPAGCTCAHAGAEAPLAVALLALVRLVRRRR